MVFLIISYTFLSNISNISDIFDSDHIPCYAWVDDSWCDSSCNIESCNYDGGACDACGASQCYRLLELLEKIPGDDDDSDLYGNDLITQGRVCLYKDILVTFSDEFDASTNCSQLFATVDLNENGFIGGMKQYNFCTVMLV